MSVISPLRLQIERFAEAHGMPFTASECFGMLKDADDIKIVSDYVGNAYRYGKLKRFQPEKGKMQYLWHGYDRPGFLMFNEVHAPEKSFAEADAGGQADETENALSELLSLQGAAGKSKRIEPASAPGGARKPASSQKAKSATQPNSAAIADAMLRQAGKSVHDGLIRFKQDMDAAGIRAQIRIEALTITIDVGGL